MRKMFRNTYRPWLERLRARGAARSGTLGRVVENAVWLLSGKAVGAILSLIYLGMATRTLGPDAFGQFVLILGAGQAVSAIVTFSTWQVVVRYGMAHLQAGDRGALGRLLTFCLALDAGAAVVGCILATIGVVLLGPRLGWDARLSRDALLFCFAVLLSFRSTAVGILRLHDRFGIAAAADAVTPVTRLLGALVVVMIHASVTGFLIAWAAAEMLTATAHWIAAFNATRAGLQPAPWRGMTQVGRDNPGLWRFALVTNIGATLRAFSGQISVLLVGLVAGPAAAGGYRLAFQLGRALAKLSDMLARSMFAEIARVHVVRTAQELRKLFLKSTRFSLIGGAVIIILLLLIGKPALGLVAGKHYVAAYPLLLMLGTAAALDLGGTSFEPSLMATGRASLALRLRLAATILQIVLLVAFLPTYGVTGAAAATLAASSLSLVLFGAVAWRAIYRRKDDVSTPVPSA
ncbi:lipopolysaccharide biosynthesis protein [Sphingomonas crusticola]|uniref:lipopolysaccharide biosynthesis protein n=1 Tax=Sphingomonas crusticola TaxID=1697973 RepID=UPI000E2568B4|nr:lipopolysaccharide biosynthesis protein [Sphingomonas crusticola]